MTVQRAKTALNRSELSRPIRLALENGLINGSTAVFDYGCGRGGDLKRLRRRGVHCSGWDPAHRPSAALVAADVVNLGYVVNVVENPDERAQTLRRAWGLSRSLLIVSAQLVHDAKRVDTAGFADGVLTRAQTFQKYFEQQELREWIDSTLTESSVAAAPGVFYVFRDSATREEFVASRYRSRRAATKLRHSDRLFEEHRDLLAPLVSFMDERGRLPAENELENYSKVVDVLGSVRRAALVLRRVMGEDSWSGVKQARSEDILVYLALSQFGKRLRFSILSDSMQRDVRAFFSTFKAADSAARELLYSVGHPETLASACRSSDLGKSMPSALYVARSAVHLLPPELRVYEACARQYIGDVDDTNVVKLRKQEPRISYLNYPDLESNPHPVLSTSVTVDLQTFRVRERRYDGSNPPILHRKEELLEPDHPQREKFERLTRQEERFGLFDEPSAIGTRDGWSQELKRRGLALRGHRVVRGHPATASP